MVLGGTSNGHSIIPVVYITFPVPKANNEKGSPILLLCCYLCRVMLYLYYPIHMSISGLLLIHVPLITACSTPTTGVFRHPQCEETPILSTQHSLDGGHHEKSESRRVGGQKIFGKRWCRSIKYTNKLAEAEFVQYLDITEVELYCKSSNAEERQNIICNKIKTSLCCYNKGCLSSSVQASW